MLHVESEVRDQLLRVGVLISYQSLVTLQLSYRDTLVAMPIWVEELDQDELRSVDVYRQGNEKAEAMNLHATLLKRVH
jgi:hypothetical protein